MAGDVIDIHTHFYADDIAPYVVERYSQKLPFCCDGTKRGTLSVEREAGVSRVFLLPVATTPCCSANNAFAQEAMDVNVCAFATMHPDTPDPEREIFHLRRRGFFGLKIHPQFQSADIDDSRYLTIFSAAARNALPVLFHAGEDPALSPPWRAAPKAIARMLDKAEAIDGLILIAAHLGGMNQFDDVEKYVLGRDIYMDTALVGTHISKEQYRRIVDKHGYQKILFGSDCPWQSPAVALAALRSLGLPKHEEQAILHDNAMRLFHLSEVRPTQRR